MSPIACLSGYGTRRSADGDQRRKRRSGNEDRRWTRRGSVVTSGSRDTTAAATTIALYKAQFLWRRAEAVVAYRGSRCREAEHYGVACNGLARALADAVRAGAAGDADAVARDEVEEACRGPLKAKIAALRAAHRRPTMGGRPHARGGRG